MPQEGPSADRLDSWKAIAAYVGRDVRTVVRWEQRGGLPVYRVPVGQRQAVYAFKHEIDQWMAGSVPGSQELAAALQVAAALPGWRHGTANHVGLPQLAAAEKADRSRRFPSTRALVGSLVGMALLVAVYVGMRAMAPRQLVFTGGVTQITSDGVAKTDLLSDGRNLFFSEWQNGRAVLATVPTQGGTIRHIPTPFENLELQAVSADGKSLLAEAWEGQEWDRKLWVIPTAGGAPVRVGQVLCHSATLVAEWTRDRLQLWKCGLHHRRSRNGTQAD